MTTTFASMASRVLVNMPECPQPSAEAYLRLAAIDFCRRSFAWIETQAAVLLDATDMPYTITPPANAKVVKVLSVVVDGIAPGLEESSVRSEELYTNDWRTAIGTPLRFIEAARGVVSVVPLPLVEASFVVTAAFVPTEAAAGIPDAIYDEYGSAIISGAIYMLAIIPQKPWTSGDLAALHKRMFESGIDDASINYSTNYAAQSMNVAPPPI